MLLSKTKVARHFLLAVVLLVAASPVFAPPRAAPHVAEPFRSSRPAEDAVRSRDTFAQRRRDINHRLEEEQTAVDDERQHWLDITKALGVPTQDLASSYVVLFVRSSGPSYLTTNYVARADATAPIIPIDQADLSNATAVEQRMARLIGAKGDGPGPLLKVITTDSLDSNGLAQFFDKVQQTFRFDSDRFRTAELFLRDSNRVFSLESVSREGAPPRWMARLNKCCVYAGIPPDVDNWGKLSSIALQKRQIQVVSLFRDTETTRALSNSGLKVALDLQNNIANDPIGRLKSVFESGPADSPVVVIGHVEGPSFTVEGEGGFQVKLEDVVRLAEDTQRPVFLMGCYTAVHYQTGSNPEAKRDYPVTTLSTLFPQALAARLKEAASAKNMQDFTALLSDDSLYLWVSNNFMRDVPGGKTLRAPLYANTKGDARSIVGFVFFFLPCKFVGGC